MIATSDTSSSTWASCPPWGPPCTDWSTLPIRRRLAIIRRFRITLAAHHERWVDAVTPDWREDPLETLTAELFPLADAAKYLERNAASILRPRRVTQKGSPVWLNNTSATIHREPCGWILILAPSNYPLMLAGVQTLQALAAGNSVAIKPSPVAPRAMQVFVEALHEAGVPDTALRLLEPDHKQLAAVYPGIAKVLLTGSHETGRAVQRDLAPHLVPSVMELSGVDAMVVLQRANPELVANALAFGMKTNASATCIAPRRIVLVGDHADLLRELRSAIDSLSINRRHPASDRSLAQLVTRARALGGTFHGNTETGPLLIDDLPPDAELFEQDVMAPVACVIRVKNRLEAVEAVNRSPYGLGASVFGPVGDATEVAERLDVGTVTINDVIVPTADPRLPFAARKASGFGVTRGEQGLLELTRTKVITARSSRRLPMHLLPEAAAAAGQAVPALFQLIHGNGWWSRLSAMTRLFRASRSQNEGKRP
ncbi:aldehyde dehydrogenase family protein [Mucisphaera calidilacus]|uniref:Phenylacetaldehyde dehydrogenase n=1 Tax=Mucisphaera calidilacus TaxID=2527982 RepID=A0A518BV16_9BACT|nr:aldehyde dehydrogenase family protein [Mucisphaera calidilacus]QDU70801.1 Phenylacetaldehyde dehydrogenase [Mucisphaera calidilacus]